MDSGEVYKEFFAALVKGGLEPVVRTAYRLLNRPIAIGDETGAKLMQMPEEELGADTAFPSEGLGAEYDDVGNWNELFRKGTIGRNDYLKVHSDLAGGSIPYNEPVLVRNRFLAEGNQVITIFARNGSILTFVTVLFGDDRPTEEEMQVIRVFVQAVRPEIVRLSQFEKTQETRLKDILEAADKDSSEFKVSLSALQKEFHPDYQLLYIAETSAEEHSLLRRISRSLNAGMLSCVAAVLDDSLAVLAYGVQAQKKALRQLANLLGKYPVDVGVSTVFTDLFYARDYYFQAYTTLLAGRHIDPQHWLYRYEDYVPYQMCAATALQADLEAFVHPAIMRIARYDAEKGSDWMGTISALMEHDLNKGETAKALNVHPNTLAYRLKRIEELFGVDCSDPKFLAAFYSSSMALRYRGKEQ